MKIHCIAFFIFIFGLASKGQNLPTKISEQPDGITVHRYNSIIDTCLPEIFIGDSLQILFPCYSKGDFYRKDISEALEEITMLKRLVRKEFLLEMSKCCSRYGNPDSVDGIYLTNKKGNSIEGDILILVLCLRINVATIG